MSQQLVLGIGTSRNGMAFLARLLGAQPSANVSLQRRPLLAWNDVAVPEVAVRRLQRFRHSSASLAGDVASNYLPYVESMILAEPQLRIICVTSEQDVAIEEYSAWLDESCPNAVDLWSRQPAPGWDRHPVLSRLYPKFDVSDRVAGLQQYWQEYSRRVDALQTAYSDNVLTVACESLLANEKTRQQVLTFAGVADEEQVTDVEPPAVRPKTAQLSRAPKHGEISDSCRCVILVPCGGAIAGPCDDSLRELERRGYEVRRVRGYSQIDIGRSQMATDALIDGFAETMWIDSDVGFDPDSVERLRSHNLPVSCGIYPKKGERELACHVPPELRNMQFGRDGGLYELTYAATGFLHVRREVYEVIQEKLPLPLCNEEFGRPLVPYFLPLLRERNDGQWYLGEDYAFCERARQAGYSVVADTTIRLWHYGNYGYGWEDAGRPVDRFSDYRYDFS